MASYRDPTSYTTTGTGDGSESSIYLESFGLATKDGSGNPPETLPDGLTQKSAYNKDLDLVQNMRNCFEVVKGFKEQVDALQLVSGYGGWTIITEDLAKEDRIEGLMYLRVSMVDTALNVDGVLRPRYKVQAEMTTKTGTSPDAPKDITLLSFYSDGSISVYDNSKSYHLTATTVEGALDELSHRSIIIRVTVPVENWAMVTQDEFNNEPYQVAYVVVPEMLGTDYPIVTLLPSTNLEIAAAQLAEASHISRIQTMNGRIAVYCYDGYLPKYELTFVFRILRGGTP